MREWNPWYRQQAGDGTGITLSSTEHDSAFVVLDPRRSSDRNRLPRWAVVDDVLLLDDILLLPTFRNERQRLVLWDDLRDSRAALMRLGDAVPLDLFGKKPLSILVGSTTRVDLAPAGSSVDPAYYAAVRNLFRVVGRGVRDDGPVTRLSYFGGGRVATTSRTVVETVRLQLERSAVVRNVDAGQFAHSAYYMGSKRALRSFIVEAIDSTLPDSGVVVDLMCGSGSATGAFSRLWRTVASDAQSFCRILATVQGGGYQRSLAEARVDEILEVAREHTRTLQGLVDNGVTEEEEILHSDLGEKTLRRYSQFLTRWPTYPAGAATTAWDPVRKVHERRGDPKGFPYCLFTAYYANVYFGLRQAVEIDSLRYAIERVCERRDRIWALGALIASVSALGSTFGGYFAQPPVRRPREIGIAGLARLLERRAASITHEFCARYVNLASESEAATYSVETVPGPWRVSLDTLGSMFAGRRDITVYVDAPYTREEYSRYYHVLETLVTYGYPDSVGAGRVPSKKHGGRFSSEFFTRSAERLAGSLCSVISAVLERNWVCVWSYSNRGGVGIPRVVDEVRRRVPCEVRSYAVPYTHKALGSRRAKAAMEHLIVFVSAR